MQTKLKIIFLIGSIIVVTVIVLGLAYRNQLADKLKNNQEGGIETEVRKEGEESDITKKKEITTAVIEGSVKSFNEDDRKLNLDAEENFFFVSQDTSIYQMSGGKVSVKPISDLKEGLEIVLEYNVSDNKILSIKIK